MSAAKDYPLVAAHTCGSALAVEMRDILGTVDDLRFKLVGVNLVMESVREIVNWFEWLDRRSIRVRPPIDPLLHDLRASYFAYLYAKKNPGEVVEG